MLGTKNYDYDFNNVLAKLGYDTYFCGNSKSSLIPKDKWVNINYTDIESIYNFLVLNKDFKYILPGSNDLAYLSVCEITKNKKLNNLINIDELVIAKNYLLKSQFRKKQVSNFVDFPFKLTLKTIENRKEKFLLKHDGLSGGKGIYFFENWKDFKKVKSKIFYKKDYVFEEFINGTGHGASFFWEKGLIILEFFDNEYYAKDNLAVIASSTPSILNQNEKDKLRNFCYEYTKEHSLCDGLFHIQCIRSQEKIFIIECTRRLPGDYYHIFASLYLQKSYLTYYINGFINEFNLKNEEVNLNKCYVRIIYDEKIKKKIDCSKDLECIIKNNTLKTLPMDGFRFGLDGNRFKKKMAIFLVFETIQEANNLCEVLSEDL